MPRGEHFRYTPTPSKSKWTGWLAGDPVWLLCHTGTSPTKPCLRWITHAQIDCPRCVSMGAPKWLAYVPVYRESDHAPCLVIVQESGRDLLEGLGFAAHVVVMREDGDADGVCVRKSVSGQAFKSIRPARQAPADITQTLLAIWQLNELTEWYRCQSPGSSAAPSPPPPPPPPPAPAPVPAGTSPEWVRRVADTLAHDAAESEALAARQSDSSKRLKQWIECEKNGKLPHKPK
jgi:hypothetical protein